MWCLCVCLCTRLFAVCLQFACLCLIIKIGSETSETKGKVLSDNHPLIIKAALLYLTSRFGVRARGELIKPLSIFKVFFLSLSFFRNPVPDLNGRKRIHNAYYGHIKNSTLLIFNLRMRMSQYFHIKTDIMFCLGLGSFFYFSCSHAPLVYLLYMAVMQIILHALIKLT